VSHHFFTKTSPGAITWRHMATPGVILVKKNYVTHHFRVEFYKKSRGMGYFWFRI